MGTGAGERVNYQIDGGAADPSCTGLDCGLAEVLSEPLPAAGFFVGMALLVALTHLPEAREALEGERSRAAAERDAFAAFVRRVRELAPSVEAGGTVPRLVGQPAGVGRLGDGGDGAAGAERAYAGTVGALDHYETEFDEPIRRNMAAELGEDVVAALESSRGFTPELKRALVAGGREAAERRETYLDRLDRESDRLAAATGSLERIEARIESVEASLEDADGFHDAASAWRRLDRIEADLDAEAERFQRRLHDRHGASGTSGRLREHLYADLEVDFPVVAEAGELAARVEDARRDASPADD